MHNAHANYKYRIIHPNGEPGILIEAKGYIVCEGCGSLIKKGQYFTRHNKFRRGRGSFCQNCYPFKYQQYSNESYQRSSATPILPILPILPAETNEEKSEEV